MPILRCFLTNKLAISLLRMIFNDSLSFSGAKIRDFFGYLSKKHRKAQTETMGKRNQKNKVLIHRINNVAIWESEFKTREVMACPIGILFSGYIRRDSNCLNAFSTLLQSTTSKVSGKDCCSQIAQTECWSSLPSTKSLQGCFSSIFISSDF